MSSGSSVQTQVTTLCSTVLEAISNVSAPVSWRILIYCSCQSGYYRDASRKVYSVQSLCALKHSTGLTAIFGRHPFRAVLGYPKGTVVFSYCLDAVLRCFLARARFVQKTEPERYLLSAFILISFFSVIKIIYGYPSGSFALSCSCERVAEYECCGQLVAVEL